MRNNDNYNNNSKNKNNPIKKLFFFPWLPNENSYY